VSGIDETVASLLAAGLQYNFDVEAEIEQRACEYSQRRVAAGLT
jgi:hypothetical protein